jgi:ribosomal protein S18 acetylase RimI-like enzyme
MAEKDRMPVEREVETETVPCEAHLRQDLEFISLIPGPAFIDKHLAYERKRVRTVLDAGGWAYRSGAGSALLRVLPWDSDHFGISVAELTRLYLDPKRRQPALRQLLEACHRSFEQRDIQCVVARVRCDQLDALHALEDLGLRLMDTSLELGLDRRLEVGERSVAAPASSPAAVDIALRIASEDDSEKLSAIAESFTNNRFHRDPRMSDTSAAGVYRSWVKNAASGKRQKVLLAETAGEIAGFCTYDEDAARMLNVGIIALLTVAPEFRGQGIARALVSGAMDMMNTRWIVTSTQVENIASQRTFTGLGFKPIAARHILHGWLGAS